MYRKNICNTGVLPPPLHHLALLKNLVCKSEKLEGKKKRRERSQFLILTFPFSQSPGQLKARELGTGKIQEFLRLLTDTIYLIWSFCLILVSLRMEEPHIFFFPLLCSGSDVKPPFGIQKNTEFKWSFFSGRRDRGK